MLAGVLCTKVPRKIDSRGARDAALVISRRPEAGATTRAI